MARQQTTADRQHRASKRNSIRENHSVPTAQQAHPLQQLQQAVGNAQLARLLSEEAIALGAQPEVGRAGGTVSNTLASRIYGSLGGGRALESQTQARMEAAFGVSLDGVRIHDDAEAGVLSLSVGASAFTLGNDIFFSDLASPRDEQVLKHELTHVIQQRDLAASGPLTVGPANDAYEHQAEAMATSAVRTVETT